MGSPAWVVSEIELPFPVASVDPKPGGSDPLADDAGILVYPQAGAGEQPLFVSSAEIKFQALDLASTLVNLVPILGQIKGLAEGLAGQDFISGRKLAGWERALNVASALTIPHAIETWKQRLGLIEHSVHEAHGLKGALGGIGHQAHQVNTAVHVNHAVDLHGGRGSGQGGSQ
jgi:hypothetical protein